MTKTLAIYFSSPERLGYPLDQRIYREAYAEMIKYWKKKGLKVVIVRADSYEGKGYFSRHSIWNEEEQSYQEIEKPIRVDLIWNRDSENTIPRIEDCAILNHPDFDELCRDKWLAYQELREISGHSALLGSYDDFLERVDQIPGKKIVLKPRYGEGAYGVHVLEKAEVTKDLYENWNNILMQEFLDSSQGIEGLVEGHHEVNVIVVDGEFAGARIKKPAEGMLVSSANSAQKGKVWGIHFEDVPKELWSELQRLAKKFETFSPCLFRADFVKTTSGTYKLIEINSRPGVMHPEKEGKEFYWDFNGTIADTIVKFLNSSINA